MTHPLTSKMVPLTRFVRNSTTTFQTVPSLDSLTPMWAFKNDEVKTSSTLRSTEREFLGETDEMVHRIQAKINTHIESFLSSTDYENLQASMRGTPYLDNRVSRPNLLLKCFETVLDLCHLSFTVFDECKQDSAICILPIDTHELSFNQYIITLMLQLCKFPCTFFKKLNLRVFSFCHSVTLENPSHKEIYYKRVLNGLFEVETNQNPNAIKLFFYKFLVYHISKKTKSDVFTREWKSLNPPGFCYTKVQQVLSKEQDMEGFLNIECMKSPQTDQALILERLITNHQKVLDHSDNIVRKKAQFMMETLLKIDPNFTSVKGWRQDYETF